MYKITYPNSAWEQSASGADIVQDYITHSRSWEKAPCLEEQVQRLAQLVGVISDKLGINLLEVIDRGAVDKPYTHVRDDKQ
jgi:ABC-type taurine transport system substrate-binding protein